MKAADRVILNTENMADDFRAYYSRLGPEKFSAIPNGCDPDVVPVIDRLIADQPNRGGNGTIRICHPGSLYRKRDPRPIVDAVRELAQDGVHVVLEQIGNRALGFDLPTYVEQRGLTAQVTLEEHLPHEQVLRRMARADVLMVIQPGTPTQVPGKLFEMLLFKKPILAIADEGATADIIRRFKIGAVAPGDDPQAIAGALRGLIENRQRYQLQGGWTEAHTAFDGRSLTGRLAKVLEDCFRRPTTEKSLPDDLLAVRQ